MTKPPMDEAHIANLIRVIQSAPAIETIDGRIVYMDTPASSDAMSDLVDLFYARLMSWNVTDDQRQTAMEAVVRTARTMVPTTTPTSFILSAAHWATKPEAHQELQGVTVSRMTRYRVLKLLDRYDHDIEAAYNALVLQADKHPDLTPATFVAAVRAIAFQYGPPETGVPDRIDQVVSSLLVHEVLLPALTPVQHEVVLMFYGFTKSVSADLATRLTDAGFSVGDQLTDTAISSIRNTTRPAVHRHRMKALSRMRQILEQETP